MESKNKDFFEFNVNLKVNKRKPSVKSYGLKKRRKFFLRSIVCTFSVFLYLDKLVLQDI